jgi:transcriptional regulator with XRE-family HTH domain
VISGDLIREARLRAGLTQRELARRSGTTQPAVARWENGAVLPSFERLRQVLRACGLDLWFRLVNADDSYRADIEQYLQLSVDERVEHALRRAELYQAISR